MNTNEVSKESPRNPVQYVTPPAEISENDKAIQIAVDMPGVGTNGRRPRHYRRRFTLSDTNLFDLDNVAAKMSHGVLEVEIPMTYAIRREDPIA